MSTPLSVLSLTDRVVNLLRSNCIDSVDDLENFGTTADQLKELEGVGPVTASTIADAYQEYFDSRSNDTGIEDTPREEAVEASASLAIPGDADCDGAVDEADSAKLADHWGASVSGGASAGDFNKDGVVNATDAAVLAANWTGPQKEAAAVEEPEPAILPITGPKAEVSPAPEPVILPFHAPEPAAEPAAELSDIPPHEQTWIRLAIAAGSAIVTKLHEHGVLALAQLAATTRKNATQPLGPLTEAEWDHLEAVARRLGVHLGEPAVARPTIRAKIAAAPITASPAMQQRQQRLQKTKTRF